MIPALTVLALQADQADGAVTIRISQSGSDVLMSSESGSLQTEAWNFFSAVTAIPALEPDAGIIIGDPSNNSSDEYSVSSETFLAGPGSFGDGTAPFAADSGTGATFGLVFADGPAGSIGLTVPSGYSSGAALSATSSTFLNQTIEGMGLTQGSYTWTWGAGQNADSLTVQIIPEPSSLALALGALALIARRRRA